MADLSKPRLGWVGTGVMGRSMCGHCLRAGYEVTIFNRTPAKMAPLISMGARAASSPKEVAEHSDIIFSIVGFPRDVREVYFGEQGIMAGARSGSILVDCTTTEPTLAKEIYAAAQAHSISALDAPVSGGDVGAREARLTFMVGGDRAVYDRVLPILQFMGKCFNYMGGAGSGQHTKMVNQINIASIMVGVVEGLVYAYKAGLNMEDTIRAIAPGAAGSWSLNNYGPRILSRNFDPGFFVEHFIKDMGICLSECAKMRIQLPGLELSHRLYCQLREMGHGNLGTHSLILAFERMNDLTIPAQQLTVLGQPPAPAPSTTAAPAGK
ncbi:putative 2-hydroxy-3-oxopropionate reductase [Paratrimastix pyriformis]|uniref:2-hydroxy-3-oxopropionate reductase n=1 Tax=Paratrimastix pyriformis TaxID=342808 RepID=A0ABQ8UJZ9_9EUKA|nr:putative 2-hydroxy-3-oxopropionate reductase [Paratrimastix pyriformis]